MRTIPKLLSKPSGILSPKLKLWLFFPRWVLRSLQESNRKANIATWFVDNILLSNIYEDNIVSVQRILHANPNFAALLLDDNKPEEASNG